LPLCMNFTHQIISVLQRRPFSPSTFDFFRKRQTVNAEQLTAFRINTCKNLFLNSFGMNTYKKGGGGGVMVNFDRREKPATPVAELSVTLCPLRRLAITNLHRNISLHPCVPHGAKEGCEMTRFSTIVRVAFVLLGLTILAGAGQTQVPGVPPFEK